MRIPTRHLVATAVLVTLALGTSPASAAETVTKTTKTTTNDGETKTETETTTVEEDRGGEGATKSNHRSHGDWIIREYGHHDRPMQLDVSIGLFYDGVGAALWYAIPIVPDGFIRPLNDSFDLEFGLVAGGHFWGGYGVCAYDYVDGVPVCNYGAGATITPLVGVRWNFFLTPAWTVFASLKFGWQIGINYWSEFGVDGTVGAIWRFSDFVGLRLELGYPLVISAGLSFDLGSP